MSKNELDLLAMYLDRAVKEKYFEDLNHFRTWKESLETGEVKTVLNTLIGFMLPDLHSDVKDELERWVE